MNDRGEQEARGTLAASLEYCLGCAHSAREGVPLGGVLWAEVEPQVLAVRTER